MLLTNVDCVIIIFIFKEMNDWIWDLLPTKENEYHKTNT